MDNNTRLLIIALVIATPALAQLAPESRSDRWLRTATSAGKFPPTVCWVEHVQVQPARITASAPSGFDDSKQILSTGNTGAGHVGSEHWNAAVERACQSGWATRAATANHSG